jgi:hypothetical protein
MSKIAFAVRAAQLSSAFTGIVPSPRDTREFKDEISPAHT